MTIYLTQDTVRLLLPEILVIALAVWTIMAGAVTGRRRGAHFVAIVGLALVGFALFRQNAELLAQGVFDPGGAVASGPLLIDYFGQSLRWLSLLVGFGFVLLSGKAGGDRLATEYLGSLLLLIAGTMLVCVAHELVLLFLALELISIPTYILLYLGRRNLASQEATAKYFFLSILSSALLLYGFSFLYGIAGSTELTEIRTRVMQLMTEGGGLSRLAPLAVVLVVAGAAFKLAAVPFQFYAPDVYQGTTSTNAGVLAVAPKLAGVILLARLLVVAMPGTERFSWQLLMAISMITMTLGNVLALWQQNIRRMLAYSSIAHAGYLLMGLAVALALAGHATSDGAAVDGLGASLFYLLVYMIATVGTFAALTYLSSEQRDVDGVDELAGLGTTHPLVAIALALFMFSLTGIPPLAGFWGKLSLLLSALSVGSAMPETSIGYWFLALAIVAAVNAAISAGYYLRVVAVMYFRGNVNALRAGGGQGARLVTMAAAVLVVAVAWWSSDLLMTANQASRSLQTPPDQATIEQAPATQNVALRLETDGE